MLYKMMIAFVLGLITLVNSNISYADYRFRYKADGILVQKGNSFKITTNSLSDAEEGTPYTFTLNSTNPNNNTLTWSSSSLPTGLNLNTSTGEIFGTPSVNGSFSITFTVSDGTDSTNKDLDLTINTSPSADFLIGSDTREGSNFGTSVSLNGNYALVTEDDGEGYGTGYGYIFDISTGTELHKLSPSDQQANDKFGATSKTAAIGGNYAAIGAFGKNSSRGAVYVFNISTGTQVYKLEASDGTSGDSFGYSLAIDGNNLIVGAYTAGTEGAAYVFNLSTGTEVRKLTPSDTGTSMSFGESVAIDGNYIVVGASRDDENSYFSGAAYVFDLSTGNQLHKLMASDGASYDRFGISVGISGSNIIVGSYGDDFGVGTGDAIEYSGAAYIFNAATGTELFKLDASDKSDLKDSFGYSVSIDGTTAVISAPYNDDAGISSGSVYVFNASNGSQVTKFDADDTLAGDNFGNSIYISGSNIIISADKADDVGNNFGKAYIFNTSGNQITW